MNEKPAITPVSIAFVAFALPSFSTLTWLLIFMILVPRRSFHPARHR